MTKTYAMSTTGTHTTPAVGPSVQVGVVSQNYPLLSQTFVWREVEYFHAPVLCEQYLPGVLDKKPPSEVYELRSPWLQSKAGTLLRKISRRLSLNRFYHWPGSWQTKAIEKVREWGSEVLLAQFGPMGIAAYPIAKQLNLPLFVYIHGMDASSLLRNAAYTKAFQKVLESEEVYTLVCSQALANHMFEKGISPWSYKILHQGVPTEAFAIRSPELPEQVKFLSVGRFTEKKAPHLLIRSFNELLRKGYRAELHMVGTGPLKDFVEAEIAQSPEPSAIHLWGAKSNQEVLDLMQRYDVFVQHSRVAPNGDREGWPVAIAEASASGLPIVSTRHSGIVEQVVEGKTGYLVEEGDWQAMAHRMIRIVEDKAQIREMGQAARQHIKTTGDFTKNNERLSEWMREAVARKKST